MVAEGITEIAYGVHSDGSIDFIDTYDELSRVAIKTLRGYLVDIFPWRKCLIWMQVGPHSDRRLLPSATYSGLVPWRKVQAGCG